MARILIAEDEEQDRLFLQTVLEQAGHELFFAKDGDEALRNYEGNEIEVVVTDLHMPLVHGLELITALRDFSPRPAIIAVSGAGKTQLDLALHLGADATLTKPVDASELLEAVSEALAKT